MKKIILIFTLGFFSNSHTQGCSDAGICSIANSFHTSDREYKNRIEIGSFFGAGEADVSYFSPYVTYTTTVNDRLSLSSKITYSVASGSFGKRGGLGDGYLIGNYNWKLQLENKN